MPALLCTVCGEPLLIPDAPHVCSRRPRLAAIFPAHGNEPLSGAGPDPYGTRPVCTCCHCFFRYCACTCCCRRPPRALAGSPVSAGRP